ncbi:MAG: HIT domain-containing protein [Flavobacteriales bacterium]|nr:HIT domain-containing protein [Flavobacteriales bacterium]MCB9196997.1 HIT domain-containing protein [Flavobacteriales bacterium]
MDSIFTKIIKGEITCYKIAENDKFLAFLDIRPLVKGHSLVIPKIQIDKFFDLPEDYLSEILVFGKEVARAIEVYTKCERVGLSVIGLEVPHAHLHLIPINSMNDMNFANTKQNYTATDFEEIASGIRKSFVI